MQSNLGQHNVTKQLPNGLQTGAGNLVGPGIGQVGWDRPRDCQLPAASDQGVSEFWSQQLVQQGNQQAHRGCQVGHQGLQIETFGEIFMDHFGTYLFSKFSLSPLSHWQKKSLIGKNIPASFTDKEVF